MRLARVRVVVRLDHVGEFPGSAQSINVGCAGLRVTTDERRRARAPALTVVRGIRHHDGLTNLYVSERHAPGANAATCEYPPLARLYTFTCADPFKPDSTWVNCTAMVSPVRSTPKPMCPKTVSFDTGNARGISVRTDQLLPECTRT